MTVKVGILGAGFMGQTHGRILRQDPRVRLDCLFDTEDQRKQEAARSLECHAADTEDELLHRVDAVFITVPNTLHAAAATKALSAVRHIFLEKPFTTSLDDARRVLEAARSHKGVFQVGHNRRFAPAYREVKRLISEEGLEPTLAHFKMNRGELENPVWVGNAAVTGGYLYETPLHLLDMAVWLLGPVESVGVASASRVYEELDNFSFLLRFRSGVSLTFATCAHAGWAFPFERIEVFGKHFTIGTEEMDRVSFTRGLNTPTIHRDFHQLAREDKMGYTAIDRNFISAVLGEEEPQVTAEDGFRAVELVDRCYSHSG